MPSKHMAIPSFILLLALKPLIFYSLSPLLTSNHFNNFSSISLLCLYQPAEVLTPNRLAGMPVIVAVSLNLAGMIPLAILLWNYLVPATKLEDQIQWLSVSIAFKTFLVSGAEFLSLAPKLCPVVGHGN
jgi:hypothetical protein